MRVELVDVAIAADRFALYILHHEIRQAIVARASIDQPRDVWVVELRQNLPLVTEAPQDAVGIESAPDQFNRDLARSSRLRRDRVHTWRSRKRNAGRNRVSS